MNRLGLKAVAVEISISHSTLYCAETFRVVYGLWATQSSAKFSSIIEIYCFNSGSGTFYCLYRAERN